jgi:hypothetical protein
LPEKVVAAAVAWGSQVGGGGVVPKCCHGRRSRQCWSVMFSVGMCVIA